MAALCHQPAAMDSHTPLRPVLLGGLTNTPGRCQQVWQFPPWTQDQRGSCQCLYPHLFLSAKSGSTHRCWKCQTIFQQSVGNPSISTCHLDACPAQRHPGRCRVATRRGSRENPHFPARRAPEHRRHWHQELGEAGGELLVAHLTAVRHLATLHPAPGPVQSAWLWGLERRKEGLLPRARPQSARHFSVQ